MSIENILEDLTTAVKANTAALKAPKTASATEKTTAKKKPAAKPAAEKKDPPPSDDLLEDEGLTREQVKTALKGYAALEGKEEAIKILKDHGASSIGELDSEHFQAVIDATE